MATPNLDPFFLERVKSSYQTLSERAKELNAASDDLSGIIADLNDAFKRLNLGVVAWARFAGDTDHDSGHYWSREVGYAKVGGKWSIAIADNEGDMYDPEGRGRSEVWPFHEAPRSYRIQAVDAIPELIEKLIEQTAKTTQQIIGRTAEAKQIAEVLAPPKKTVPRQK